VDYLYASRYFCGLFGAPAIPWKEEKG